MADNPKLTLERIAELPEWWNNLVFVSADLITAILESEPDSPANYWINRIDAVTKALDEIIPNARRSAEAALRQPRTQWQDIASAPQGQKVLLGWSQSSVINMGRRDGKGSYAINSGSYFAPEQPDVWAPLPEPPEASGKC